MNKSSSGSTQLRVGNTIYTLRNGAQIGVSYVYKSLLANQPTPPKRRYSRKDRFAIAWNDSGDVRAVRIPRLFKGHRP